MKEKPRKFKKQILLLILLTGGLVFLYQLPSETDTPTDIQLSSVAGEYENVEYGLRIEIKSVKKIDKGIELLVRAWKGDTQLGFGKDGSIEWERLRIYNPPTLVPDGTTRTEIIDGKEIELANFKEDPSEAIQQTLAHTIHLVGKDTGTIIKGTIGSTTSTFFPDADTEISSVDGATGRGGVDEDISTITAGAGAGSQFQDSGAFIWGARIRGSATTDQWQILNRGIYLFLTSSIPDTDNINSATLSLMPSSLNNGMSGESFSNSQLKIVSSNPASDTAIVEADYNTVGSTEFGASQNQADMTVDVYEDIVLNASGLANISKTGVSKFATRSGWDLNNTIEDLTWGSGASQQIQVRGAETAGTTQDPKLVVVHSDATRKLQPAFRFTSREVTEITSDSAVVSWKTSILTDIRLNWSSSRSEVLGQSSFRDLELKTSHSVSLENLSPDTTYYYVIHAAAPARGNIATGPWSFTTLPALEDTEPTDTEEDILTKITQQFKDFQLQVIQLMRQFISFLLGKV